MAELIQPISTKMADVAHSAVKRVRENRTLAFVGLGLLVLGAGAGIWVLVKKAGSQSANNESDFEPDDFRRSGQY